MIFMKKAFLTVLALVLMVGLIIPAIAAPGESPTAPVVDEDEAAPLPMTNDKEGCFVSIFEAHILPVPDQELFKEAQTALKDVVPDDMAVRYFYFHNVEKTHDHILRIANATEVDAIFYLKNDEGKYEWTEFTITDKGNNDYEMLEMPRGPFAILTK